MSIENNSHSINCYKNEDYDFNRYALIVYFGTPIAVAGVVCNWILIKLYFNVENFKTPTLYLFILAILDFLMDLFYIPFFTFDALAIYHEYELLYYLWNQYALFIYGFSKMIQFTSTYIIVCATIERFIVVSEISSLNFLISPTGRYATIITTLIGVLLLRLPAFFEYYLKYLPDCPIYKDYQYVPMLASWEHYQMFNFYVMTVLHIFVPFVLLLIINISIVIVTKKKLVGIGWAVTTFIDMPKVRELIRKESISSNKKRRDELRYATWTMVSITTTYLCCSSLSLLIGVMENVWPNSSLLIDENGHSTRFYTLSSDMISILVAINSLLRIFVYMLCSPNFRHQLLEEFGCSWCLKPAPLQTNDKNNDKFFVGYHNMLIGGRVDML